MCSHRGFACSGLVQHYYIASSYRDFENLAAPARWQRGYQSPCGADLPTEGVIRWHCKRRKTLIRGCKSSSPPGTGPVRAVDICGYPDKDPRAARSVRALP